MNLILRRLQGSSVTQRRAARLLHLNRKTVARKFLFLASQARLRNSQFQASLENSCHSVQFDEMESFERTKLLPLSIPLIIEKKTRKILGYRVCRMPAKGLLANASVKKYGRRKDDRTKAVHSLFEEVLPLLTKDALLESDQNPKYPKWIPPGIPHKTHKGQRGCGTGQGELKKIGFDPLFDLNHSCAMLRANISRLVRRTWCVTQKLERLDDHIALYVDYHNRELTV